LNGEFGHERSLFCALWLGSSWAITGPLRAAATASKATVVSFVISCSLSVLRWLSGLPDGMHITQSLP